MGPERPGKHTVAVSYVVVADGGLQQGECGLGAWVGLLESPSLVYTVFVAFSKVLWNAYKRRKTLHQHFLPDGLVLGISAACPRATGR